MDNWTESQQQFISRLSKIQTVLREIRDKDKHCDVIQYAERDRFENLMRRNGKVLDKLQKREFTVAVVGLEKAGKSTLANALLRLVVLPEYTERCTYTTTEIRAGEKDLAKVYFYSKDKFAADFRQMLDAVGYPQETDWSNLDIDVFEKYWRSVQESNPMLYQQHNGTTVEDIRAILDGKGLIQYLTGKDAETLDVTDGEDYAALYKYITGIEGYENGHAKRTATPYAVEKVIVQSSSLADMRHIILYDVPGFDSPTDLHRKQTADMLKKADAIILVTNVGDRPNLTGTQLDMLQKGRDEDGVGLNEKVFVFGNKLDMAGNPERASDNAKALAEETVKKYNIAKEEHIICGSAKAYLESNGLESVDEKRRGTLGISATLQEWGIPDGIEKLKQKMNEYYNNDRFEVLSRRAEKIIGETESFLSNILSQYESNSSNEEDDGSKYLLQSKDAMEQFVRQANAISREFRSQIGEEAPFSSLIRDNIETIYPEEAEYSERVRDAENSGIDDKDNVYAISRIDAFIREKLQLEFQKNIVEQTANATQAKEDEIYQKLADDLLYGLGMNPDSSYRKELEESTKELFKSLLIENGEHCYFNPLIERYATGLIEVLIRSPFASVERFQKLMTPVTMTEFQSLAVYYSQGHLVSADIPVENQADDTTVDSDEIAKPDSKDTYASLLNDQVAFFTKILAHTEVIAPSVSENETALRNFFEENSKNLAAGFDISSLPFDIWATLLAKLGIQVSDSDLLPRLEKALINFVGNSQWATLSPRGKNAQVNNAIIKYCVNKPPKSLAEKIGAINAQISGVETKAEMLHILNDDIAILRDMTLHAVIPAIGLERAFNSVMSKNIDMIRDSLENGSGQDSFNRWLKANIRRIRESEFSAIEKKREVYRDKRAIAQSIREVLNKLQEQIL